MFPKLSAECIGTFWLVLGGCGSAVLAAAFPGVGIGLLGVSLAFGLTVLSGAYASDRFQGAISIRRYRWDCGRATVFLVRTYCRTSSHRWPGRSSARGCCI